jgi:hypothetical protein
MGWRKPKAWRKAIKRRDELVRKGARGCWISAGYFFIITGRGPDGRYFEEVVRTGAREYYYQDKV